MNRERWIILRDDLFYAGATDRNPIYTELEDAACVFPNEAAALARMPGLQEHRACPEGSVFAVRPMKGS